MFINISPMRPVEQQCLQDGDALQQEKSRNMPWTILKVLSWSEGYFAQFEIDSPRLTAEMLLAHALDIRRLDLYLQFDRPLNSDELTAYKVLIQRRVKSREPVAYITGEKGFWTGDFFVSHHVLIPRPDTETLVEQAIEVINGLEKKGRKARVLDMGTGSGAIVLSLAQSCPGHHYFALDCSFDAIMIAKQNQKPCPSVQFLVGSWLTAFRKGVLFDLIVSNPPYIPTEDILTLQPEIKNHEPKLALDGGEDGFDCYRKILPAAPSHLSPDGVLMMEMGSDQRSQMEREVAATDQYASTRFVKDYAEHDRVVILSRK